MDCNEGRNLAKYSAAMPENHPAVARVREFLKRADHHCDITILSDSARTAKEAADALGIDDVQWSGLQARFAAGHPVNAAATALAGRHTFNGTLDYRFRWYDDSDRRNDSDLRWNLNVSRPVDEDNLRFGMRGRTSYRGDGQHRNDWGVFADYRLGLGARDQLTIGGEVRERRYPSGPLRSRTRDIAELTARETAAHA